MSLRASARPREAAATDDVQRSGSSTRALLLSQALHKQRLDPLWLMVLSNRAASVGLQQGDLPRTTSATPAYVSGAGFSFRATSPKSSSDGSVPASATEQKRVTVAGRR
jgi:hypothetical protein